MRPYLCSDCHGTGNLPSCLGPLPCFGCAGTGHSDLPPPRAATPGLVRDDALTYGARVDVVGLRQQAREARRARLREVAQGWAARK